MLPLVCLCIEHTLLRIRIAKSICFGSLEACVVYLMLTYVISCLEAYSNQNYGKYFLVSICVNTTRLTIFFFKQLAFRTNFFSNRYLISFKCYDRFYFTIESFIN